MELADTISEKFKRSWHITKKTFEVMMHDKEILIFPILSAVFSIILFAIFIIPWLVATIVSDMLSGFGPVMIYLGIFIFYFGATFLTVFFNAGVVHIAKTRLEGGDATFADGIGAGFTHIGKIFSWSLLSATVGVILNILESQANKKGGILGIIGNILVSLIGFAWAIVSVFVVPAMVIKNLGPIDALKSSTRTIKKTWGESLIRYYGLGFAKGAIIGLGILLFLVPGFLFAFAMPALGLMFIALFIFFVMLVLIIFSAANTIFNTALFLYAENGKESKFYSKDVLNNAFKKSKLKKSNLF